MPALRERQEDITALARLLLQRCAIDLGRSDVELSRDAEAVLARHQWPGNIRELRNVLERALLMSDRNLLTARELRFGDVAPESDTSRLTLLELERRHIERVLNEEGGRVEQAADRLGIPRSSLYQKIKKHRITVSRS